MVYAVSFHFNLVNFCRFKRGLRETCSSRHLPIEKDRLFTTKATH